VLAVGPGKLLDDGSRGKMDVLDGMTVVFSAYAGHDVELDGAEYLMMTQADILGVIE
jgi:chaperonin GroES